MISRLVWSPWFIGCLERRRKSEYLTGGWTGLDAVGSIQWRMLALTVQLCIASVQCLSQLKAEMTEDNWIRYLHQVFYLCALAVVMRKQKQAIFSGWIVCMQSYRVKHWPSIWVTVIFPPVSWVKLLILQKGVWKLLFTLQVLKSEQLMY